MCSVHAVAAQVQVVSITPVPGVEGTYPTWSPDAQTLAFDPSLDETPVWLENGDILFASDRSGFDGYPV